MCHMWRNGCELLLPYHAPIVGVRRGTVLGGPPRLAGTPLHVGFPYNARALLAGAGAREGCQGECACIQLVPGKVLTVSG